jgi:hypothetical protein
VILPNKYLLLKDSLIGISPIILDIIEKKEMGVEEVWDIFKKKYNSKVPTYNKFLYTLDFMYITGMINFDSKGRIFNENIKS